MQTNDRLHALDAVRAFALLGGIALHAAIPFVSGLPYLTRETPSDTLAVFWYTIHMFRMPLFFLIAGFFGRMVLERRGTGAFVRDRSMRILLPLVFGFPVVMAVTGLAWFLGALSAGMDLQALQPPGTSSAPSTLAEPPSLISRINLIHLWFLYYLVIFYTGALLVRSMLRMMPASGARLLSAVDTAVRFLMRGVWGPMLLALPIAIYFSGLGDWSSWGGWPAPFSDIIDVGALIGYGLFFSIGWLLHRQPRWLMSLEQRWPRYGVLAVVFWIACMAIGGPTPHWGPYLQDVELQVYTVSYVAAAWCWSFAIIGIALRFLSSYSPVWRYLADSSYWLYLMHIAALVFFGQLLHPLAWHWSIKYPLCIAASMTVLLVSYHFLVRFTIIGATLNGRRHPRATANAPQGTHGELLAAGSKITN
jgi:peptidoglycan/LPS O-acetylase OafA/YrhL